MLEPIRLLHKGDGELTRSFPRSIASRHEIGISYSDLQLLRLNILVARARQRELDRSYAR